MVSDDLSQRLWRHGARLAWEDECQEWVDSYKSLRDWANAKLSAQEIELNGLREDLDAHSGPECMAIASALELAEAEIDRLRRIVKNQVEMIEKIQDMLSYLDLHMAKYPITQLTTEQKELYANLVDAGSLRSWEEDAAVDHDDPEDKPREMDRWWR
jgi:hypothetical protein